MGSQERVENAMYYDRLLDGLIKGVNQSIGGASFRYSFEQLFASLLNIDGANEFYTVENCWLAICPFLQAHENEEHRPSGDPVRARFYCNG